MKNEVKFEDEDDANMKENKTNYYDEERTLIRKLKRYRGVV